jgi:uridine kinase
VPPRASILTQITDLLIGRVCLHTLRVAVDGRGASGKTTFADELACAIRRRGHPAIRASVDHFLRPRAERYARGRYSAEGYYLDARDHIAIRRLLLDPLGPGGDGVYCTMSFDEGRDQPIEQMPATAAPGSILVVDGTFLQRPELRDAWDFVIFLDVSAAVAESRALERDAPRLGGLDAARALYKQRYLPAYATYEGASQPMANADAIVGHDEFAAPRLWLRTAGRR